MVHVSWARKGGQQFLEGAGLEQGPPFPGQSLLDLDGGTQHVTSPLQIAKRALKRAWEVPGISIFTQVGRLKAHHRRAEPVNAQVRMTMRYGLVIPHFIQKGAD